MGFDKRHLVLGLAYLVLGMALGIMMAVSENHSQLVTHAHLLLVGFVVSTLYAVIHRLWLAGRRRKLAWTQWVLHHGGVVGMVSGLYLLYGGLVEPTAVAPMLKIASLSVISAAILMYIAVFIDAAD